MPMMYTKGDRTFSIQGTADQTQVSYDYDALANLARTTDAAGHQTTLTYNVRGFKTASSDPDIVARN